jgi:Fe-S cluster assembly protein SufD
MEIPVTKTDIKQDMLNLYSRHSSELESLSVRNINSFRKNAYDDFVKLGIPDTKNEAYKYTPVETYLKGDYDIELRVNPFRIDLKEIFCCDIPELDTDVVLVLNGFYYIADEDNSLPEGIIVCGLNEAAHRYPLIFGQHYSKYADTSGDGLVALNTLFAQDGVFVYLPENAQLTRPLQIINLSHSITNLRITRRNLIVAEKGSRANIVVCDHTLCNQGYLTNSLTEIYAGENSHVDYARIQNENNLSAHIDNLFVHQMRNSNFKGHIITLHAGLSRNNFFISLNEPGANCNLNGLFLCDEKQHVTNYVLMNHKSPYCTSNQLFKGILDDESTGAFNGKIHVWKDAQKTQAYQRNNNILLSSSARMNSKPHLEIYADDVKCSHGATTGQIDNDAMFYLRTRGIGEKEARHLLMHAFANEVISEIFVDVLKTRIIRLIEKRLRSELVRCDLGCR